MNPLVALEIINNTLKLALSVWESMTPEQKRYWLQKGIDNDKAVIAAVEKFLTSIGIELPK